jgi:uncharacterized protein YjbI with pentapeptide repeats
MRILKPLYYASPLVAPFDDGKRLHCVVTVMVHVSFAGQLEKEQDLWMYAADETEGMVLDEGKPKPRGEWLVHGSCYARRQGVGQSFVKATVDGQEKVLAVFGRRAWTSVGPSAPEPFSVVPIRFPQAFGGPKLAENPAGTGYGGDTPPPLVEVRSPLVTTPRDKPPIAGLGRIDPLWPQRMKRAGTYDDKWYKTRYPGVSEDFDGTFFMLALPDQWRSGPFAGSESFSMVNMHPVEEQVGGRLPGIIARAFVKRKDEDRMVDVRMSIDTVVFYPHKERLVLVCRGATRTRSDTLADIEEVGLGVEWIDRPKTYEQYMEAFAVKRSRRAGLKRLDDTALLPEGNPPKGPKQRIKAPGEGLLQRQMERSAAHKVAEMRKIFVEKNLDTTMLDKLPTHIDTSVDPDDVPAMEGPPPTVEGIQEQIAKETEAGLEKMRQQLAGVPGPAGDVARKRFEEAAEKARLGHAGPPTYNRLEARMKLESVVERASAAGLDTTDVQADLDDPKLEQRMRDLEAAVRESYRTTAQYQRPAPRLGPEASAPARARVFEMVKKGEPFAFVDLTGADLSGLDLRGARMSRAWLESADLTGADLAGAELDLAVLARADLAGTDLSKCKTLKGANLSEALVAGTDFSRLDLSGCFFSGADLTNTRFVGAILEKVDFGKAKMVGTDLSGSKATALRFHKLRLERVVIRGVQWDRPLFFESEVSGLDARGADIKNLSFVDTMVEDCTFDDATLFTLRAARALGTTALRRCSFVGTVGHKGFFRGLDMQGSDFRHSDMRESDFSGATLDGSQFQDARLVGARFVGASIRRCSFDRADMMEGLLSEALMDHASFEAANLFRADFARSGGGNVSMSGANVNWVRTAPKREESP